jgi:hypothetical protein
MSVRECHPSSAGDSNFSFRTSLRQKRTSLRRTHSQTGSLHRRRDRRSPRSAVAAAQAQNSDRALLAPPANDGMAPKIHPPSMDGSQLDFSPLPLGCWPQDCHSQGESVTLKDKKCRNERKTTSSLGTAVRVSGIHQGPQASVCTTRPDINLHPASVVITLKRACNREVVHINR